MEQISNLISNLKVEVLETAMCKGHPGENNFSALDELAEKIAKKHLQ